MKRPMTIEEFEEQYAARSGVSVDWLHDHGRRGALCSCGYDGCEGYQMLHFQEPDHYGVEAEGGGRPQTKP